MARVLVSGASSGVGAAAALAFAQAGDDVAVVARSREGLERVAERVAGTGARCLVLPLDLTDQDAIREAVATVEREWGGLDIAVSNAAAMAFGPFTEASKEDFDRTIEVTFIGAVNLVRAALPALERTGGVLVVTGSINALAPLPGFAPYTASKHALRAFLRSLRIELRVQRSKVRIAIVNPGAIATPVWRAVTSATGRYPRRPPEGYSAETIARALVAVSRRPRVEMTIGGEAKLFQWLWRTRPFDDLILGLVFRYYLSGRAPADENPLWEPTGDGSTRAPRTMVSRPSLWAPIRTRIPWPPQRG